MAINRESNAYTIIFAVIMVAVVGILLAFVSEQMKPIIKANQENEKKQNILQAMGMDSIAGRDYTRDEAQVDFPKYVKRRITLSYGGEILRDLPADSAINSTDKLDAFNVDIRKEYRLYGKKAIKRAKQQGGDYGKALANELAAEKNIHYPLFVCEAEGKTVYVVPAVGTGLWDDVWGYIGLSSDCVTINGAVFDHKAETPGLGSKVTEEKFQTQFRGKFIYTDSVFAPANRTSIEVAKPGTKEGESIVDGISGATFTGAGVAEMLGRSFGVYQKFFEAHKEEFVK